jgi:7,8-dihydroneopterin aldolase/epimerase/oxygenase
MAGKGKMTKYTITMKNCAFFARHGFFDEEIFLGQRFFVDVVMDIESKAPVENDQLSDTVDYGVAFKLVEEVVLGKRHYLIEALATEIAKKLCDRFPPIRHVEITVRKPNAPVPGVLDYVEVKIDHTP